MTNNKNEKRFTFTGRDKNTYRLRIERESNEWTFYIERLLWNTERTNPSLKGLGHLLSQQDSLDLRDPEVIMMAREAWLESHREEWVRIRRERECGTRREQVADRLDWDVPAIVRYLLADQVRSEEAQDFITDAFVAGLFEVK